MFLAGHLIGNLLVFVGREAFNVYAELLQHMLHGAGVWIARIVLLSCLLLHIAATISLTRQNRAAREAYEDQTVIQAKKSSLIMIWSGLTILAFVIFHLLQFTVKVGYPASEFIDPEHLAATGLERFDAWRMVIVGFSNPLVVIFYLIAMSLLCSHISHGVQSMFQTFGFRSAKTAALLDKLSIAYAAFIWIGFCSIPLFILIFKFGR